MALRRDPVRPQLDYTKLNFCCGSMAVVTTTATVRTMSRFSGLPTPMLLAISARHEVAPIVLLSTKTTMGAGLHIGVFEQLLRLFVQPLVDQVVSLTYMSICQLFQRHLKSEVAMLHFVR